MALDPNYSGLIQLTGATQNSVPFMTENELASVSAFYSIADSHNRKILMQENKNGPIFR